MELLTRGERILLVVDTHSEMNSSWDDKRSRLQALKEGECRSSLKYTVHVPLLLTVVVWCCFCSS
jgi:LmbE family N-acetylglucosaminyl deacetylase